MKSGPAELSEFSRGSEPPGDPRVSDSQGDAAQGPPTVPLPTQFLLFISHSND